MSFADNLRRAREEVSMPIVMLSDETGIPVASLAALEAGEMQPCGHHVRLCARELGVRPSHLTRCV